jgi:hypothetical protein
MSATRNELWRSLHDAESILHDMQGRFGPSDPADIDRLSLASAFLLRARIALRRLAIPTRGLVVEAFDWLRLRDERTKLDDAELQARFRASALSARLLVTEAQVREVSSASRNAGDRDYLRFEQIREEWKRIASDGQAT